MGPGDRADRWRRALAIDGQHLHRLLIESRIDELTLPHDVEEQPRMQSLVGALRRLGEKAPKSPKEMGTLRLRLVQSGYRGEEALTVFFGIRIA